MGIGGEVNSNGVVAPCPLSVPLLEGCAFRSESMTRDFFRESLGDLVAATDDGDREGIPCSTRGRFLLDVELEMYRFEDDHSERLPVLATFLLR